MISRRFKILSSKPFKSQNLLLTDHKRAEKDRCSFITLMKRRSLDVLFENISVERDRSV